MRTTFLKTVFAIAVAMVLSSGAAKAEKWDMPMAYADSNFHTQNGKDFAAAVGVATGGKLEIVIHGGGSLFKGNEIKRAVQTGQAPIGFTGLDKSHRDRYFFSFGGDIRRARGEDTSSGSEDIGRHLQIQRLRGGGVLAIASLNYCPANGLSMVR